MIERTFDPKRFFDDFPRFVETSETGRWLDRLNARYFALVHSHRELIRGASVLDLASHDGRFSFAALLNGATRVTGIEHDEVLVEKARENMDFYEVPHQRYEIILGDMFDRIDDVERCDVVFCFGILYHINDHMLLLSKIAELEPRVLIIDSNVSRMQRAAIELRNPMVGSPPPAGGQLEGWPSRSGLEAMLSSFGWTIEYFDWAGSGLAESPRLEDYRTGRRLTAAVKCNERVAQESRDRAVEMVFDRRPERRSRWLVINEVAAICGMKPQTLNLWVRRAERRRSTG